MSKVANNYDDDYDMNKEHEDRKAWLEANGLDEPLGCKNPLDILIMLEIEIELES
jgi:hypothetical protein